MTIAETLLPEFDREMGVTRRLLDRVPDGQFAWQPHDKSMTLGRLVEHLAQLPGWAKVTISERRTELVSGQTTGANSPATRAAVLHLFDKSVAEARAALTGKTDAELLAPWTLMAQGKEVFTMPKALVLRSFVMNHMVHHRGQLSVYLRMHNIALPSIYGPSGDAEL